MKPDCPDLIQFALLRVGSLPADEAANVRSHASTCPRCAALLNGGADESSLSADPTPAYPGIAADREQSPTRRDPSHDPVQLGHFRLLARIGEGGMGRVFRAEDTRLGREVAVKLLQPELAASRQARERFLREARAIAALDHEHVLPVYHVGEERGVPFLVMPLLRGESLADRLRREAPLPGKEVIRVGREAALGLAAAHAKGIVHRDIKPANLWLDERGGRVRLLDFGLARAAVGMEQLTAAGAFLGTPAYTAPEQIERPDVDGRADLFSLGCLLFLAATGELPFTGGTPLAVLLAVRMAHPKAPALLNPGVRPELSDLILRLLAKDPNQRPPSAAAVAEALAAMVSRPARSELDDTLRVDPPVPIPRQGPRRAAVLAGLIALAVLTTGIPFLLPPVAVEHPSVPSAGEPSASEPPEQPPAIIPAEPFRWTAGQVLRPRGLVPRPAAREGLASWALEWREPPVSRTDSITSSLDAFAVSGDGRRVAAVVGRSPEIYVWDRGQASAVRVLATPVMTGWNHRFQLSFAPNGRILAATGSLGLEFWDVETGRLLRTIPEINGVGPVVWTPDGTRILLAFGSNPGIDVLDVRSGKRLRTIPERLIPGKTATGGVVSPDGKTVAVMFRPGGVGIYRLETSELICTLEGSPADGLQRLVWSPDSRFLLWGTPASPRSPVLVWDASTGKRSPAFDSCVGLPQGFAPDGRLLTVCDRTLRVWSADGARPLWQSDPRVEVTGGAWCGDRTVVALAVNAVRFRWFDGTTGELAETGGTNSLRPPPVLSVLSAPDGRLVIAGGAFVSAWSASTRSPDEGPSRFMGRLWHPSGLARAGLSFDGSRLAVADSRGDVRLLDWPAGTARGEPRPRDCQDLAWRPGTHELAEAGKDGTLHVRDADTGEIVAQLEGGSRPLLCVRWSPDGSRILTCDEAVLHLWDAGTGELLRQFLPARPGAELLQACEWSPDGRAVAVAGLGLLRLIETETGGPAGPWNDRWSENRWALTWSPDGRRLASVQTLGVDLVDVATGDIVPLAAPIGVRSLTFSRDGRVLFTGNDDGGVRAWDAKSGRLLSTSFDLPEAEGGPVVVSGEGHIRGSDRAQARFAFVTLRDDGTSETLTLEEFGKRYGWRNDPGKATPQPE